MRNKIYQALCTLSFLLFSFSNATAAPALEVLGKDAYSKAEQGDHFLMFKNPVKFTKDLQSFLEQ